MSRAKVSLAGEGIGMVERGYGQVEGNKLSARYNGKIFAQLPVAKEEALKVLQNGMFVKYDYAKRQVNLTGKGEWMLVFNEVKVYDSWETDADYAMIAGTDNGGQNAIVYNATGRSNYTHYLPGTAAYEQRTLVEVDNTTSMQDKESKELNPYGIINIASGNENYPMVPRLFKTDVGDIMTTNTIEDATLAVGDTLTVNESTGVLKKNDTIEEETFVWQVVKTTTMPDGQKAVKIMRIV